MSGSDHPRPIAEELEVAELLAVVDVDRALQETAAEAFPSTRGDFLRRGVVVGAAATGALALADIAEGEPSPAGDTAILRFDLVLEYLQAGLYTEAERIGALTPSTLGWSRVVGAHERAHAAAIKGLLGSKAVASPTFNFHGVTESEQPFIKTAVAFEELTGALLKWQAVRLHSRSILAAVATLHSVEARHAAWIRHIIGLKPAASAFDEPASQERMARLIASTHFVTSKPRTNQHFEPPFTG